VIRPARARARRWVARERAATPIVVDASIAVQWFSAEDGSVVAARLLEREHALIAPDIMPLEATNAWWKKVRRGDMAPASVLQAVSRLLAVGIALVPSAPLLARAARLAIDLQHPVYDCVYLVVAGERDIPLASDDDRLRRAAARLGIPLWRR
jgi:predicted nucleic acid-binding protein